MGKRLLRLAGGLLIGSLLVSAFAPAPRAVPTMPAASASAAQPTETIPDLHDLSDLRLSHPAPGVAVDPTTAGAGWQPTIGPADGSAYDPDHLAADLAALRARYPEIRVTEYGTSRDGRPLLAACLGQGPATVQINAAHHAREHMTINLALAWLEFYAQAAHAGDSVAAESIADDLAAEQLCILPVVNPDGVVLVQRGADALHTPELRQAALAANGGSSDFSGWKANAAGVDLNSNYPFGWAEKQSPAGPAPAGYKGPAPLSEPESAAVAAFTQGYDTRIAVSLHAAGNVIYWYVNEHDKSLQLHRDWAAQVGALDRYALMPPDPASARGGMKDWFVAATGRFGLTLEIGGPGGSEQPVTAGQWPDVWARNWQVPALLLKLGRSPVGN